MQTIAALGGGDSAGDALNAAVVHVCDADLTVLPPAAAQDGLGQGNGVQQRIVTVEDGKPVRRQVFKYLALGLQDALPRVAQIFDVGIAHVGDNGDIGPHQSAQIAYLAKVVHARLDDRSLVLRRQVQQSQRRADVVVVVGLSLQGIVPLGQDGGHHLLGRGLAGGAGDLHHGQSEAAAIPGSQGAQGQTGVLHQHVGLMGQQLVWTAGRQAALCAAGEGGVNIGVAVEALAGQGDKQLARRDGAAVGGDAGNGGGAVLQHRTAHGGAYLLNGTGNHGQIAPSARYGGPGGPRLMGASAHALTVLTLLLTALL